MYITLTNGAKVPVVKFFVYDGDQGGVISIDDGCYTVCIRRDETEYTKTTHIFPEALEALKALPSPKELEASAVFGPDA